MRMETDPLSEILVSSALVSRMPNDGQSPKETVILRIYLPIVTQNIEVKSPLQIKM
jgi:hypothetical protein